MSVREREGLIARIRHLRRVSGDADARPAPASANPDDARLQHLERRLAHLEQLVEGLQDSVHRESARHDRQLGELDARIQPAALVAALSRDARERGL
jgi:uncharacterized coiled-coil protein SlyX